MMASAHRECRYSRLHRPAVRQYFGSAFECGKPFGRELSILPISLSVIMGLDLAAMPLTIARLGRNLLPLAGKLKLDGNAGNPIECDLKISVRPASRAMGVRFTVQRKGIHSSDRGRRCSPREGEAGARCIRCIKSNGRVGFKASTASNTSP